MQGGRGIMGFINFDDDGRMYFDPFRPVELYFYDRRVDSMPDVSFFDDGTAIGSITVEILTVTLKKNDAKRGT